MSRAFVKEGDGEDSEPLPERPLPLHTNYVTVRGLAQLQTRARDLAAACDSLLRIAADDASAKQKLRTAERDLRYFHAQLERADAAAGDISWASPLARALIGARVGDVVTWRRPVGATEIEILGVTYEPAE